MENNSDKKPLKLAKKVSDTAAERVSGVAEVVNKEAFPAALSDKDRLEALLAAESVRHAQAQLQIAQMGLNHRIANEEAILVRIRATYGLGPTDTYNTETGEIARS